MPAFCDLRRRGEAGKRVLSCQASASQGCCSHLHGQPLLRAGLCSRNQRCRELLPPKDRFEAWAVLTGRYFVKLQQRVHGRWGRKLKSVTLAGVWQAESFFYYFLLLFNIASSSNLLTFQLEMKCNKWVMADERRRNKVLKASVFWKENWKTSKVKQISLHSLIQEERLKIKHFFPPNKTASHLYPSSFCVSHLFARKMGYGVFLQNTLKIPSFTCEQCIFSDLVRTVTPPGTGCILGLAPCGLLPGKTALKQLDDSVASHLFTGIIP